jgi:hypothetical protein
MSAHQLGQHIAAIATPATGKNEPMLQILSVGCGGQIICGRIASTCTVILQDGTVCEDQEQLDAARHAGTTKGSEKTA